MAKQPKHGLQLTTSEFQLKGIVSGVQKDKFYVDKKTQKGKDFRSVNFGVEFEKGKTIYISLNGMPQEKVYFSKKDKATNKTVVKDVPFSQRATFKEEGFQLIGINLGLEKDDKGNNIKKRLVDFDACKYIAETLTDGMSVFIKGNIEYSSFQDNDKNTKRLVKFIPSQISLCSKDIDFESETFESLHAFAQQMVFQSINKDDEGDFTITAKSIAYSSIEDCEFVIKKDHQALASTLKKQLKPYNSIRVHGLIEVTEKVEEVSEDVWGDEDTTKSLSSPTKRDLVIVGATPSTLSKGIYTEEIVLEGIKKLNSEEQAKEDWGESGNSQDSQDEEDW